MASLVYEPREDSQLLSKHIGKYAKGHVLDVGTGSGILAVEAAKKARKVTAVDVNPAAIDYCKKNISHSKIEFKKSDLFKALSTKFDNIIFNPPYLPEDKNEPKEITLSTTGGRKGHELVEKFLLEANNYLKDDGKILFLISSLTNPQKVETIMQNQGFRFKKIDKEKYAFEELYVYLAEKSPVIKKLKNVSDIKYLAKGHRGMVYSGTFRNKTVAVKVDIKSNPISRVSLEAKWLKQLNKKKIGPKLIKTNKDNIIMEFIDGQNIYEYMRGRTKNEIRHVIKEVLTQCNKMDKLGINKDEMHHPIKHILINNNKVTMIDFERCKFTEKPKNVTQFCHFLTSANFAYGLENKGLIINRRILKLAQKYKGDMSKKNFEKIIDEI
jgi:release factor glutamine methyltransferase